MASNPLAWTVSKFVEQIFKEDNPTFKDVTEQFPAGTKFYNVGNVITGGSMLAPPGSSGPRIEGTVVPFTIGSLKMEAVIPAEAYKEGAQTLESWMATEKMLQTQRQIAQASLVAQETAEPAGPVNLPPVTVTAEPFDAFLLMMIVFIVLVIL